MYRSSCESKSSNRFDVQKCYWYLKMRKLKFHSFTLNAKSDYLNQDQGVFARNTYTAPSSRLHLFYYYIYASEGEEAPNFSNEFMIPLFLYEQTTRFTWLVWIPFRRVHIFITMQLESGRITIYKHHAKLSVGTYFKVLLYEGLREGGRCRNIVTNRNSTSEAIQLKRAI